MKAVAGFLIFVSLIVCCSSCQKEIDWGLNNGPQSDSSYLDKAISFDTTLVAGSDTVEKLVFLYDNAKRLSRMIQTYGTGFADSSITDYFYSGSDTLPFKQITREILTGIYDYTDTSFYSYSNRFVSRDSVISRDNNLGQIAGASVTEYMVSGSNVNRSSRQYDFVSGNFVLLSNDLSLLNVINSGGNLISQTLVSGTNTFQSVQATYDNKPNPLLKVLKIKFPEADTREWLAWLFQKNNPAQVQYQEMGFPVETEIYNYAYRSDGWPLGFTFSTTAGNSFSNKVRFYYKVL